MIKCEWCHELFEPTKGYDAIQKYCGSCKKPAARAINKITKRKLREYRKLNAPIVIPKADIDDGEVTDFIRERMDMLSHEFRPLAGSWLQGG
jgi:hypothetical protein